MTLEQLADVTASDREGIEASLRFYQPFFDQLG